MLSISEYHALRSVPITIDHDPILKQLDLDIEEIHNKEPSERAHRYEWCLGAVTHDRISIYMSYILAFHFVREEFVISTSLYAHRWHVNLTDEVSLIQDVVHRIYSWDRSGKVSYEAITLAELQEQFKGGRSLEIKGITGSHERPYAKTSEDLKKWFKEEVLVTIGRLAPTSFSSVVWRYEEMNFYPHVKVLYKLLKKEGFHTSLEESYFVLKHGCPFPYQALSISVDDPPRPGEECLSPNFSIHKVQLAIQGCKEKVSFDAIEERQAVESLEEGRVRLLDEIKTTTKLDPLIKRYAFNISMMVPEAKSALCQELTDLGYLAFIDVPFICRGEAPSEVCFKQYLMIDLP